MLETQKSLLKLKSFHLQRLNGQRHGKLLNSQYRSLGANQRQQVTRRPVVEEVTEYWSNIIGVTSNYKPDDSLVLGWERLLDVPLEEGGDGKDLDTKWETIWIKFL